MHACNWRCKQFFKTMSSLGLYSAYRRSVSVHAFPRVECVPFGKPFHFVQRLTLHVTYLWDVFNGVNNILLNCCISVSNTYNYWPLIMNIYHIPNPFDFSLSGFISLKSSNVIIQQYWKDSFGMAHEFFAINFLIININS